MRNQSINTVRADFAVITTDGAGAIALATSTSGISGVAFTTDGTNGLFDLTITTKSGTDVYAPNGSIDHTAAAIIQPTVLAAGSITFLASDVATPTALNLATTAVTIFVQILY